MLRFNTNFWAEIEIRRGGHIFRTVLGQFERLTDLEREIETSVKSKYPEIRAVLYHGQVCIVPSKTYRRAENVSA